MKNNSIDDISIERSDLYNFFSKINNLKVPYFQREYTWDRFQINQLINDIASSDVENYYIGSIVISKKDDKNFIIDGQQRISTFILIINYLLIWPCVDKVNFKYRNEFWLLFEKFHFESMNIKDGKYLDEIIHQNETDKQTDNKYSINYSLIQDRMIELHREGSLNKFIKNLTNTIFSLVIVNSFKIDESILFEKINSTGKQLSQFDLSKNYLLSKIWNELDEECDKNDKIECYSNELYNFTKFLDLDNLKLRKSNLSKKEKSKYSKDDLIRFFIAYKTKSLVNKEEIYIGFKDCFKNSNGIETFYELKKFALYYQYIFEEQWINEMYKDQLNLIKEQFNTFIVLIIHILELNSNIENDEIVINKDQKEQINRLFLILECYIYRRTFIKLTEKVITRKIPTIRFKENSDNQERDLFFQLYNKENNKENDYRMPSFKEFYENVFNQDANLYSSNKNIIKSFLYRLGTFQIKERIEYDNLSIEHIFPQNYQNIIDNNLNEDKEKLESKINVLGNLTLVNSELNSKLSNERFYSKKIKIISEDNFPLNNYLKNNNSDWEIEDIDNRTKYLLELTKKIWDYSDYEQDYHEIDDQSFYNNAKNDNKYGYTKLKEKYYHQEEFKTAITNSSYFRKINKELFNYKNIKSIIQAYVLDNITYTEIEETYFHNNFKGWLGQSIIEILDIKKDQNSILSKDIKSYFLSKENNINRLIEFVNDVH